MNSMISVAITGFIDILVSPVSVKRHPKKEQSNKSVKSELTYWTAPFIRSV